MKELLVFIIKGITGTDNFKVDLKEDEDLQTYTLTLESEQMGLVIGKGGQTIKAIQTLARIRGRQDGKSVFVNVVEGA